MTFTPASNARTTENSPRTTTKAVQIEEVRNLLRKEIAEKGTYEITSTNGDGWESYVRLQRRS